MVGKFGLRSVSGMVAERCKIDLKSILGRIEQLSSEKIKANRSTLKAARVQLGMDQAQLAGAAGLSRQAVVQFEKNQTVPHESTWVAIQNALEARGIVFTNGDKPGFYFDKDKAIVPT